MSSPSPTITDSELQRTVEEELSWDPAVPSAGLGVTVDGNQVHLTGTVHRYTERLAAVEAAQRVTGVHAVTDDIGVEPLGTDGRSDADIAEYAREAMKWNMEVPDDVRVSVHDGHVTLEGAFQWHYQREAAERALRYIAGVRRISNKIALADVPVAEDVQERIADALRRSAEVDSGNVHVSVDGGRVHLTGTASSWSERQRAEQAAWAAPGVNQVVNDLHFG